MNPKKKDKRIAYLKSTLKPLTKEMALEWQKHGWIKKGEYTKYLELYKFIGLPDEEILKEWYIIYNVSNYYSSSLYDKMPQAVHRDNKSALKVGSCGYNKNPIRFPRKKRKTAWKRFYKLFPHLNPENKKI